MLTPVLMRTQQASDASAILVLQSCVGPVTPNCCFLKINYQMIKYILLILICGINRLLIAQDYRINMDDSKQHEKALIIILLHFSQIY